MSDPDRRTGIQGDQIKDHTIGVVELDTVNSPADKYVLEYDEVSEKLRFSEKLQQLNNTQNKSWAMTPTYNGEINWLGWYEQLNTNQSLNSSNPRTSTRAGYGSHFATNVTNANGLPFNITVTGHSIDEATGTITSNDTEVINITANGYYQTDKAWVGTVTLSVASGKSCTITLYRTTYWTYNNQDFNLSNIRIEFMPSSATWKLETIIYKVENSGDLTQLFNKNLQSSDTYPLASENISGKYEQELSSIISGSQNEGIIVVVDQTSLYNFNLELGYYV